MLCVHLHAHHAQLFTEWLCKYSGVAKTEVVGVWVGGEGGAGGQWILPVSSQYKPKCKQGEDIFKSNLLNLLPNPHPQEK